MPLLACSPDVPLSFVQAYESYILVKGSGRWALYDWGDGVVSRAIRSTGLSPLRNSNIKFTIGTYCDPARLDRLSALDKLPELHLIALPKADGHELPGTSNEGSQFAPGFAPTFVFGGQFGAIPVPREEKLAATESAKASEKTREKSVLLKYPRRDSNLQPSASEADALSN